MIISKSKIKAKETCPLMFYFQHVIYKKPDVPKAAVTQIGTDLHKIFEEFFHQIKLEDIPTEPYNYFCNAMPVELRYKSTFEYFCSIEAERYKLLTDKTSFMPVLLEHKIKNADYSGIVDRVDYYDGEYTVLDYKSSVSDPTSLRFELNFYKMLLDGQKILDKPVKYISSYGYKTGEVFFEEVNIKSYNLMLKKVEEFQKLKFNDIIYEPKYKDKCPLQWCEYPKSCKEWRKQ